MIKDLDAERGFIAKSVCIHEDSHRFAIRNPYGVGDELTRDLVELVVAGAFARFFHHERGETVARQFRNADSTARLSPRPRIPRAVVNEGFVANVLKALALEETTLVPLPVLAALEESPFVHRLTEMDAVVAEDEAEIDGDVCPFLRAVPEADDAQQDVAAIPHADALVCLLALEAPSGTERCVLCFADESHAAGLRPVHEVGGTIEAGDPPLIRSRSIHRVLPADVVKPVPLVEASAGLKVNTGEYQIVP